MSLAGPLLGLVLALIASLPVPALVFFVARRRSWRRGWRALAGVLGAVVSCSLLSVGVLAQGDASPPTQHSQFDGLDEVVTWSLFGLTHALVLAALLVLDRRAPSS
ncbi:MAG: hypothetical protein FJ298_07340 [Planctomycetes bacterium]|nr:hypothetical protein [Planctomycetota bacterium]